MPVARSKADILCLAVYTLAGGNVLRGFMVETIAERPWSKGRRWRTQPMLRVL